MMTKRYIAFDVETPNRLNNRMSAIGVTVVEDGEIVYELYSLVNPEQRFDAFNIRLTGITPEAAADAPTFPEVWGALEDVMGSGLLIAHNAPFDLSVLGKCLLDYGVRWRSAVQYACTCRMGQRLMPELPNHRLDTMCDSLGVALDHHRADSDSRACAELLLRYLDSGARIASFVRTYDLLRLRTVEPGRRAPWGTWK